MAQTAYTGLLEYIVPNGVVAVVRDIDLVSNSSGGEFGFLGSADQYIIFESGVASGAYLHYDLRQVFFPLETFKFQRLLGSWELTVSGYLLTQP